MPFAGSLSFVQSGTDTLASLLTSNDITGIPQKQEAVKELASLPDWRQQFAAVACLVQTKTKTKTVTSWLKAYEAFVPKQIPLLSTLFSVISGVCVVSYFFGLISGYMLFGWFLIGLIISGVFIKKVNKLATHTTEIQSTFQQYYKLIIQIETQDFKAALLQDQKKKIETSGLIWSGLVWHWLLLYCLGLFSCVWLVGLLVGRVGVRVCGCVWLFVCLLV